MKKRYVGVVHLTPEGDGVIEIVSGALEPSLRQIDPRQQKLAVAGPSI